MRVFARNAANKPVEGPLLSPTPRADRRRADQARMRRRGAIIGGPALTALVVGGVMLSLSPASPAAPASVNQSVAGLATWHHAPGNRAVRRPSGPVEDLGTISGTYTLLGPDSVPAGATVAFVLTGPARLVRFDSTTPYEAEIDTTTLPDGVYGLTVSVLVQHHRQLARYRLRVANDVAAPVTPTTEAPTTEPATTEPATTEPPTTAPATTQPPTTQPPATTQPPTTQPPATTQPPTTQPPTTKPPTTQPPTSSTTTSAPASSPAAEVLSQTNAQRAANGCAPLTIDSRLTSAAQAHTVDMATNNYFAHNSQDGRTPFDRMTAAGYRFSSAGENIAMGYRTATDVMNGWMNSAGHRANILNCSYTNIGIGYALNSSGTAYWTQDFGRPA